jgi:hypothetical protein
MNDSKIAEAIDTISKAMLSDPEYRMVWQANIAMAFQDKFPEDVKRALSAVDLDIHELSNKAADYFLKTLTFSTEVSMSNERKSN